MPVGPIRFVHASDFHLDHPLQGVAEVAEHHSQQFIDAPYQAAQRVFDVAVSEEVDFVVLSGDLLDPARSGPRGVIFLQQQFQRLAERSIAVYWAGGSADSPEHWPASLTLPDTVRRFPTGYVGELFHQRGGRSVARLLGQSRGRRKKISTSEFAGREPGPFTIAMSYGRIDEDEAVSHAAPDYWALGGKHQARGFELHGRPAHYPGSPQGREPAEPGPHGCLLVDVDADSLVRTRFVATDALRWLTMRLKIDGHSTREAFERLLRDATKALLAKEAGVELLISWHIEGHGALWRELHRGPLAEELLAQLRSEFRNHEPAAWSLELTAVAPPLEAIALHEEESLLADYVRVLRQTAASGDEVDLRPWLGDRQVDHLAAELQRLDEAERDVVLRNAALLGRELLGGEVQAS